jgi:hypothetical protein
MRMSGREEAIVVGGRNVCKVGGVVHWNVGLLMSGGTGASIHRSRVGDSMQ